MRGEHPIDHIASAVLVTAAILFSLVGFAVYLGVALAKLTEWGCDICARAADVFAGDDPDADERDPASRG